MQRYIFNNSFLCTELDFLPIQETQWVFHYPKNKNQHPELCIPSPCVLFRY